MLTFKKNRKDLLRCLCCVALSVIFLSAAGCSSYLSRYYFGNLFGIGSNKSSSTENHAEKLAIKGMQQLHKKDYSEAAKTFQRLKDHYPYSKYAILAELKLGDAYFYEKKYSDAALAYDEFVRLHPQNQVIPYVLYQMGMCHFLQFSTIDRDLQETNKALQVFRQLVQNYPRSQYARKGRVQYFECEKRIVAHDFYVGQFYYGSGKYSAAKDRLVNIQKNYPAAVHALGYGKQVQKMLAICYEHIKQGAPKPSIWVRWGF